MRKIVFTIPGSPPVTVGAYEQDDGTLLVELTAEGQADLRGFFFDVAGGTLPAGLAVVGADVTATGSNTARIGENDNNMNGQGGGSYNFALAFGGSGDDGITTTSFVISADAPLTLDLIANIDMGVRTTSGPDGSSQKLTILSPAAPDAIDDPDLKAVEDTPISFDVTANDTDADGDPLTIIDVSDPANGSVQIIGNEIFYTPDENYGGGFDTFEYTISDGTGGCDTATATVFVEAVADAPNLSVTTRAGATVNQVVLVIATSLVDTDGSESLALTLDTDMLPPGATLSRTVINNPGAIEEVVLTLPPGTDVDFDLVVRSTSTEVSNSDTAQTVATLPIEADAATFMDQVALTATNQSMWSSGNAFLFNPVIPFLGVDVGPNNGLWGGEFLGGTWAYDIRVGLEQTLKIEGGSVDANLPYDVTVEAYYNETTDVLQLDPTVTANGGGFDTDGPSMEYVLDLIVRFYAAASLEIADLDVFNPDININYSRSLVDYDSETSPPFALGDEDDALSATFAWPNIDVAGSYLGGGLYGGSGSSNNFFDLNLDVDQLIADLFFGGANVFDLEFDAFSEFWGTGVKANLEILDFDLGAGMNFLQDFVLDIGAIAVDIVFENGDTFDFNLTGPTDYADASQYDLNGDGTVEYYLVVDAEGETFENDTDLGINVGYDLTLLEGGFTAGVLGGTASGSFGPIFATGDDADVASFNVFDDEFVFALNSDTTDVFAIG